MSNCATFSDLFAESSANGTSSLRGSTSRAPWRCWGDSTTKEPKTVALTRRQARQILKHLDRYLWHTLNVGRACWRECYHLIEVLLFKFHSFETGRLDPSYETIADRAKLGRSTVARYLRLLKEWGVINWVRRCSEGYDETGHYWREQESNSYAVLPPSQWKGYKAPQEPPRPERDALGLEPQITDHGGLYAGCEAIKGGAKGEAVVTALKSDPQDRLGHQLAGLGAARMGLPAREVHEAHLKAERARAATCSGKELATGRSNSGELVATLARTMGLTGGLKF